MQLIASLNTAHEEICTVQLPLQAIWLSKLLAALKLTALSIEDQELKILQGAKKGILKDMLKKYRELQHIALPCRSSGGTPHLQL